MEVTLTPLASIFCLCTDVSGDDAGISLMVLFCSYENYSEQHLAHGEFLLSIGYYRSTFRENRFLGFAHPTPLFG